MVQAVSAHHYPGTPVSPHRRTAEGRKEQALDQWSPSRDTDTDTRPASRHTSHRPISPLSHRGGQQAFFDHPDIRLQSAPSSPVSISPPRHDIQLGEQASIRGFPGMGVPRHSQSDYFDHDETHEAERDYATPDSEHMRDSVGSLPIRSRTPSGQVKLVDGNPTHNRAGSRSYTPRIEEFGPDLQPESAAAADGEEVHSSGLHYSAFDDAPQKKMQPQPQPQPQPQHRGHVQNRASQMTIRSAGSGSSGGGSDPRASQLLAPHSAGLSRPPSTNTLGSELRGRTLSPYSANGSDPGSARSYSRDISGSRRSPSSRPMSYIDLLSNLPYNEQLPPAPTLNNTPLQHVVGTGASLLDTKKTLEMYRQNIKKTTSTPIQYEFAIFMLNTAKFLPPTTPHTDPNALDPTQLTHEAKQILQRLADRAYPFAQYYLADGYTSGLFNPPTNQPDHSKAFPLFAAAAKHGHAESSYRTALAYEFGWGTSKNYPKSLQHLRAAAAKSHPGAATRFALACLNCTMGLPRTKDTLREGARWLRRATETADSTYNSAPYELALLHLPPDDPNSTNTKDPDIIPDPAYAARLLTHSASLGHAPAAFLLGEAYEKGLYKCPVDVGLSVHFYGQAAEAGIGDAMMALCARFLVGGGDAAPWLARDEGEAFGWAREAVQATGSAKAEYAVAYFTEMGIGTTRDPLEANVWYVRAAEHGSKQAAARLEIIREAAAGTPAAERLPAGVGVGVGGGVGGVPMGKAEARAVELRGRKGKRFGLF
ncbi:hypothetical protein B0A50_08562 [Salinomyces thailandicus]|uniref:HCP-like protein n=1 Tax=Salinomyces thailandicus TaxID=706561 RepID=A0A4U0TJD9_9PEZI|nr:hypothetical protein B0A50_08562 [Salinomyces thailandica]